MCSVCLIFYLLVFICMCVSEWMGFPWRQKRGWIPGAEVTSRSELPEVSAGT